MPSSVAAAWAALQPRLADGDANRHRSLADYLARTNRLPPGLTPRDMAADGVEWVPLPTDGADLRTLFVAELRAIDTQAFFDPGLWIGVNYKCVTASRPDVAPLARHPDRPLLVHMDEAGWKKNLPIFPTLGFGPPSMLELHDGVAENKSTMISNLLGKGKHCVVRYWALEIADNDGESGTDGSGDPRAQLLCEALTGHTFSYPYHFVYAQVVRLEPSEGDPKQRRRRGGRSAFDGLRKASSRRCRTVAPAREEDEIARSGGEDVPGRSGRTPCRRRPTPTACDPAEMREHAAALSDAPGRRRSATTRRPTHASDAIALRVRASRTGRPAITSAKDAPPPSPEGSDASADPPNAERLQTGEIAVHKTYYPPAEYIYPDGTVRTVPAGCYTEDEWMQLTMVAQAEWSEAMEGAARLQG